MEKLCNEGHVIDNGRETCSRCGGRAVNEVKTEPEVLFDGESSSEVEKKSEEVSSEPSEPSSENTPVETEPVAPTEPSEPVETEVPAETI